MSKAIEKPLIIFDFDGTIADSMPLCIAGVQKTLKEMNLPVLSEDICRKANGPAYPEAAKLLGVPDYIQSEFIKRRQQNDVLLIDTKQQLYPGVADMLTELSTMANLAIASNGIKAYLDKNLQLFQLKNLFIRVYTSEKGMTKSEEIKTILNEIKPEKAIMVGDREGDILAGKANKLPTICTSYGYGSEAEWIIADDVAPSVEELKQKLIRWLNL